MSALQTTLTVGLVTVIAGGLVVAALSTTAGAREPVAYDYVPFADSSDAATQAPSDRPQLDALHTEISAALTAQTWPALTPTMDEAMSARQAPDDVSACGYEQHNEDQCYFGDRAAPNTAIIVGNSIAMTFVRPLKLAMADSGWNVLSHGMFGCPFTDYSIAEAPEGIDGCVERTDAAVEAINRINPGIVFVIGARPPVAAISQLEKITADSQIVFIPPPPEGARVAECFTPTSGPADCITDLDPGWDRYEQRILQGFDGIELPTEEWFCVGGQCPAFVGTMPTKKDYSHMTHAYAERIAPVIREELQARALIG